MMSKGQDEHKSLGPSTIRVTEDVRNWVNDVRKILADYLHRPSLTQNEAIRWMCVSTMGAADELYRETYYRKENVGRLTDQPLDTRSLWEAVKEIRAKTNQKKTEGSSPQLGPTER
jgi:hypothetical protein